MVERTQARLLEETRELLTVKYLEQKRELDSLKYHLSILFLERIKILQAREEISKQFARQQAINSHLLIQVSQLARGYGFEKASKLKREPVADPELK